jgi:hypothetical protein
MPAELDSLASTMLQVDNFSFMMLLVKCHLIHMFSFSSVLLDCGQLDMMHAL